jgi:hypothetical protein
MSTEKEKLIDYWFKIGTPLALAALYFLKGNFVQKEEYLKDKAATDQRLGEIATQIKNLPDQIELSHYRALQTLKESK